MNSAASNGHLEVSDFILGNFGSKKEKAVIDLAKIIETKRTNDVFSGYKAPNPRKLNSTFYY